MCDYLKPFPCAECGKMIKPLEPHGLEDCRVWRKIIRNLQELREKDAEED